jgi:ribosomal protein S18 acetylase RimI-like enzyme
MFERMEIIFKEAEIKNIPEIVNMMQAFNAIDNYPFDAELRKKNLLQFILTRDLGRLWMIFDRTSIVGYMALTFGFSFEFKGRDAFVDELFIKEKYRSQGIGSQAIDFALRQAKPLGVKAIHLEVEKHNEKGNRLYTKKGFKEHNRFLMTKFID